ncbi:diaminohydroxyphosphoribosylaminopyrimidine deaminase [Aestuariispira insulae]|uniref:Riboflavin biosynthesis protein RibD n=1 Tax=Aestuariispira insulae TaxID=1461337 RepID=A0A3D9HV52_9PROT|nr:diaminohydroxyphosphoribosylaminopyrimidine deaminase [Aestuariispira insulae]
MHDIRHMQAALALARRGLGIVWPNPSVGCVLVKDGAVVGRGWTQPGGRPHAETEALRRAGEQARGATAYVTLEPCSHTGKTGPCSQALIDAGVARVVSAIRDPDERVSGRGIAMLQAAGIDVTEGVCREEADAANAGFFSRVTRGRPMVTFKTATTLDGRIALENGESQWITGERARQYGHMIRATHDAVLAGIGTVAADDPMLNCRLPGLEDRVPVRVVLDTTLRISLDGKLVHSARQIPVWIFCLPGMNPGKRALLEDAGVHVLDCQADGDGRIDVMAMLRMLGDAGITRLMVEGGGETAASLFRAGRVDEIAWFRAGSLIGGDGRASVAGLRLDSIADMPKFNCVERRQLGPDLLEVYRLRLSR